MSHPTSFEDAKLGSVFNLPVDRNNQVIQIETKMEAKRRVLEFIAETQVTDSASLANELGYSRAGAASTMLRLYRYGYLHRRRVEAGAYEYAISRKGLAWLEWVEHA